MTLSIKQRTYHRKQSKAPSGYRISATDIQILAVMRMRRSQIQRHIPRAKTPSVLGQMPRKQQILYTFSVTGYLAECLLPFGTPN